MGAVQCVAPLRGEGGRGEGVRGEGSLTEVRGETEQVCDLSRGEVSQPHRAHRLFCRLVKRIVTFVRRL